MTSLSARTIAEGEKGLGKQVPSSALLWEKERSVFFLLPFFRNISTHSLRQSKAEIKKNPPVKCVVSPCETMLPVASKPCSQLRPHTDSGETSLLMAKHTNDDLEITHQFGLWFSILGTEKGTYPVNSNEWCFYSPVDIQGADFVLISREI